MTDTIMVALIVGGFSFLGTFLNGKFTANVRVIRMEMQLLTLEKEVKKHNGIMERTYNLENRIGIAESEIENLERVVNK